ncbi:MAG: hypothetical protein BGO70_13390 [Bacteroidetes bacterium 43-93]|nr:phenylacetate--CoA ligase family protein [Bacteroidota bacterium]OJW99430.1 MAG: hypothetical protein BGO70_13390 [Bacteroidetes bacterium 43-93]
MSLSEKIYNHSPVLLQNAMVSIYGWRWNRRRFGGIFEKELQGYKQREKFTAAQWQEYTSLQLSSILKHALVTVPYYREKWMQYGLTTEQINGITPETINRLPLLSKEDLRKYGKSTLLSNQIQKGGSFFSSSGTTGTPTSILFSENMHQRWSAAYEARVRNWAGVDRFMRRGMIGGRRVVPDANAKRPFYRYNATEHQVYFSAYHISKQNAANYLDAIKRYKLDYMVGYAMSNYFLARFIDEQGLKAPQLRAVITSSEKLTHEMREVFQKVYGCKTYDGWSGVEACGLVSECEHGGLHISPDVGLIELLDKEGNAVSPGEQGEVVCTGFLNYDQPLIRYRIGDYMTLSTRSCTCGRIMPLIEEITGRIEDVVIGKDGREMVRFHSLFTGMPNIIKGQVVQEDINNIRLNIVSEQPLSDGEKDILKKKVYSQLGEVNVQIFEQKEIFCGINGKFRAVISNVKRGSDR